MDNKEPQQDLQEIQNNQKNKEKKLQNAKLYDLRKKLQKGLETIQQIENKKKDQLISEISTNKLLIIHFGIGDENDYTSLKQLFNKYDPNNNLYIFPGYTYAFVDFKTQEFPEKLINESEKLEEVIFREIDYVKRIRPTFFFYTSFSFDQFIASKKTKDELNNAITESDNLPIEGITLIKDFISEKDETLLIQNIDNQEWVKLAKKKYQLYGYEYLFGINAINKNNKKADLPVFVQNTVEQLNSFLSKNPDQQNEFNSLTISDFYPGDSLQPQLDQHNSVDEKIAILSLNSGIVVLLKSNFRNQEINFYLPPRSLLLLSKEARYTCYQSISNRKLDKINNEIVFRKRRVALTFRSLRKSPCKCQYSLVCDDQGYDPVNIKQNNPLSAKEYFAAEDSTKIVLPKNEEEQMIIKSVQEKPTNNKSTELEQKYVYEVYDKIAPHFSHTRYKPWPKIEEFLKSLPSGSLVADIGCGNGKYLNAHNGDIFMIGTDRSHNLISIAKEKSQDVQVFSADSLKLPLLSAKFDNAISIAVIHHFSTPELRVHAIKEILRILKIGGEALIYVWAFEQTEKSFTEQDVFVPWNLQNKYENEKVIAGEEKPNTDIQINEAKNSVVYKRYYHVFKKGEIEQLIIDHVNSCQIVDNFYDHANWVVRIKKLF